MLVINAVRALRRIGRRKHFVNTGTCWAVPIKISKGASSVYIQIVSCCHNSKITENRRRILSHPATEEPKLPELPEVETTKRGIAPHITGKSLQSVILRNRQLRWPVPVDIDNLPQQTLVNVSRRGKYLLLQFATGTAIWHLGMSGSLRLVSPGSAPGKHDHVDWIFADGTTLRFNDPRRFGALLWAETSPELHFLLAHLGPEPLSDEFDEMYLYHQTRRSQQGIKSWLMNAQNVVGVGNIYANESLFASGIHPLKPALRLSRAKCARLAAEVKNILASAIQRGGTTLRDFVGGDGKPGYFAQELNVYGRGGQACKKCGKLLTEKRVNQRTTVYCTQCQT